MSGLRRYQSLGNLVNRLRQDLNQQETESQRRVVNKPATILLLYAYNRTGKTRLSMEFKDAGKRRNNGAADTLYFNAYTEDLFTWENDLDGDNIRHLKLNIDSSFFNGLTDLSLDETIENYLSCYADFEFDIHYFEQSDYANWLNEKRWEDSESLQKQFEDYILGKPSFVSFKNQSAENIKVSRGEENIFIWCLFMAICERVLDGHQSYQWVKYLYIDDPISSLDDNNAIAVACDLANLLRRAASGEDDNGNPAPIKVVFSSHHALFFNVMCNEIGRPKEGEPSVKHKRYFLHRPNSEGGYTLRATDDTPFFHHVATLAELQRAADPDAGTLYTFHFNALRSIMEKTASFFGHKKISFCLKELGNLEDEAKYNRALNLLSHGKYAIHEPTLMGEDNQELFREILTDFITRFQFDLPEILGGTT